MTGLLLMQPSPLANVVASNGSGAANLMTDDPKEAWFAAVAGATVFAIDLGQDVFLDTVFLGFTNSGAGATWAIHSMSDMGGGDLAELMPATPILLAQGGPRWHGFARLDDMALTRYLRITVTQPEGADPLYIGLIGVGAALELAYEYRAGRRPVDMGKRADLSSGGFGRQRAALKSSFRCTLADMADIDVDNMWALVQEVGELGAVLLVEGHEGAPTQPQIHYGLFERFEPYERLEDADTRWAISVIDWI